MAGTQRLLPSRAVIPLKCFDCAFCGPTSKMVRGASNKLTEQRTCTMHGIPVGPSSIICDCSNLKYSSQPPAVHRAMQERKSRQAMTGPGWEDY